MNFVIDRKVFIEILSEYGNVLKENSSREILECLSIHAMDNKLTFTGTNSNCDLIKSIEVEVVIPGSLVFKPALVLEYIKLLEEETLNVYLEENRLHIHKAEFSVQDDNLFPVIREFSGEKVIDISSSKIKNGIEKVKFAASTSPDNLALNVIRLSITGDFVEYVTTDSFRLISFKDQFKSDVEVKRGISLPLESATTLCRLLGEEEVVSISLYQNYVIFKFKDTYFSSRVIELPFPNYEGILASSNYTKVMEFNNKELKSGLKKVVSISKTSTELKYGAVFDFKNRKVEIKVSSGSAKLSEKINMIKEGEDFRSSLNAKFLLDFVSNISDNVVIKGIDSHSRFEIGEFGNDSYRYILMPLAMRS